MMNHNGAVSQKAETAPKKYKTRLGTKDCTRAEFWRKIEV